MPLFVESIKVKNGIFFNIEFHQRRFDETRKHFFVNTEPISLLESLSCMEFDENRTYKTRVIYGRRIEKIEYDVYSKKLIQKIKIVEIDDIHYSYKFLDRSCFDKIELLPHEEAIIVKEGFVTDSRYSNLVFFDGLNWVTPDTFLLNGTKRQYLLDNNIIKAVPVKLENIYKYEKVSFINSMLDIGDVVVRIN